ncbi:MAG: hypothetical protein Q4A05_09665 [Ruminococcus sp.]|nr:hypothetical protein [Ruminococcus sp.]
MKPSELTYITQDIIDKGTFNVTSPEMMDEARRYNMDVVTNAAKRSRMVFLTGLWLIVQIPMLIASVCLYLAVETISDKFAFSAGDFGAIMSYARIGALFLGLIAYLGLFGYYIIFRFQRDPKIMFLCSAPAMLTTPLGILITMINVAAAYIYEHKEEKFSEEAGYPAFVRLNVTTVESDAHSVLDLTYDSIKERTKHRRSEGDDFL